MILLWRTVVRLQYCFSWIAIIVTFCKSSENISSPLESVNITRLCSGDQFPNPECPLKPVQIMRCEGIGIRRGCFSRSLPSNYCTKSKGTCVDSEACCWCKCPLTLPTFLSQTQSDNSRRCVSDRDLPKFIAHVRRPVCRYRMVAKQGLSSCHNATVPVLDLDKAGDAKIAVCRDVIHKARAADEYHDVNNCDLNPKEVKYLVNGVWHNLSRIHLRKLEMHRVNSRSVKLKWTGALGNQFAGLLFSMKTNCMVMEPSRVTRSTDVCLLFKSAGTYTVVNTNERRGETPTIVHTSAVPERAGNQGKVLNEAPKTNLTSSWKSTAIPLTHSEVTKSTDERSPGSAHHEDPNISMVIALSCSLAIICVLLIIGAIVFLRRYRRKRKGQETKGNTLYELPSQDLKELRTENTYEALRAPHIYQSLTSAKSLDPDVREYTEPTEQHKSKSPDNLSKNHVETGLLTKKGSFSDREVSGYIEPDYDGYPVADFQEDAPVPVNSKRLPGYYEPACIILGGSLNTLDSEGLSYSTNVENSDETPKYFVLEKQSED